MNIFKEPPQPPTPQDAKVPGRWVRVQVGAGCWHVVQWDADEGQYRQSSITVTSKAMSILIPQLLNDYDDVRALRAETRARTQRADLSDPMSPSGHP
jgi:hypothetical protein